MRNRSGDMPASPDISKSAATKFVVLIGVASLFSDFTYEGARSITGPFLAMLGASATVVAVVAGFGELIGYALRLASGYLADKTRRYWTIIFLGYALNLFAVPLLALAGRWEIAAVLIVTERMGKAVRTPARDVMLSHASDRIGRGWGFGLHEALDQIGAIIGPLAVAAILHFKGGYETSFAFLLIPALVCLAVIFSAMLLNPHPHDLGMAAVKLGNKGFPRIFWLYVVGVALVAAGYADFALAAYHFKNLSVVPDNWIPIFYAVAMGVDALAALIFGHLFDRIGLWAFIAATMLSLLFAPLIFLGGFHLALAGMALWGVRHGRPRVHYESSGSIDGAARKVGVCIWNIEYRVWFVVVHGQSAHGHTVRFLNRLARSIFSCGPACFCSSAAYCEQGLTLYFSLMILNRFSRPCGLADKPRLFNCKAWLTEVNWKQV